MIALVAATKGKTAKAGKRRKPTAGKTSRIRKVAVRSQSFGRAILRAKPYVLNPELLQDLVRQAAKKAASLPHQPFHESWAYLHAMLRLLRAYHRGEYRKVPASALLSIVAAVAYLVDPVDFIPDEIPFLGFLDDATILEFAMQKTRRALDEFMSWELARLVGR